MAEEVRLKILIDNAQSAKSVKEVRQALKEIKSELLNIGEEDENFLKLAQAAGKLQDKIGDTQATINFFADDFGKLKGAIGIVEGIAGGFSVAQGAIALFGSESEELNEVLKKTQGIMAILNGLQAINAKLNKDSYERILLTTTAQKLWNSSLVASIRSLNGVQAALVATGLGAFLVMIGAVVANWDKLVSAFEKFAGISKEVKKSTADLTSDLGLQVKVLEMQGASYDKIFKVKREILKLQAVEIQTNILLEKDEKKKLELQRDLNRVLGEYAALLKERREQEKKSIEELEKKRKEAYEKRNERIRAERELEEARLEFERQTIDEIIKIREEASNKIQEIPLVQEENIIEEEVDKLVYAYKQSEKGQLDFLEAQKNNLRFFYQTGLIDYEEYQKGLTEIEARQQANRELIRQAELAAASDFVNSLKSLSNALGTQSKEAIEFQKIVALTQIGIDLAKSISALTAASSANPANAVTFGAAGALQYATGLVQILASIAQAKSILSQSNVPEPPRFATGGYVRGKGTGTSDSIPAYLSNGEYVVNARSTSLFAPLLEAINNFTLDSSFISSRGVGTSEKNDVSPLETKQTIEVKAYVSEKEITDSQKRIAKIERSGTIY
jgi:hypothetical protein